MSEPKHTPGPWEVNVRSKFSVYGANNRGICSTGGYQCNCDDGVYDENAANARLIAEAPELLFCLKSLCGGDDQIHVDIGGNPNYTANLYARCMAAIAKAEGS